MAKIITSRTFLSVFFSVLVTVFSFALFTYATTIGNAISVTTTLDVTGATTLGDTVAVTGATTLTGTLTANGNVTLGNAETDTITMNGVIQGFVSNASSTVSGSLNVGTSVAVASSTPSQELGVVGSALFQESTGTSTIGINTVGTGVGSCIELRATDGTHIRIYATTTPPANTGANPARGLVVEAGSCL